jgi:N-methylhydantoinase B
MTESLAATRIDPITLAVVAGTLGSTVRQMTVTMERTAHSPIFKLAHDYSNAVFDWERRMVVQGADLPIHLGSLNFATKSVAAYFGDDVHEGDVFYHNDPASGGSHYQDMCMFKPVFIDSEAMFWVSNKAHMDDTGGAVGGGYNPLAEETYAEGLRIPPLRIHDRGVPRRDVIDLICGNVRTSTAQRADMAAQLAVLNVAERNLIQLVERYGKETIKAAVNRILDIGEENMRAAIAAMPDGRYEGNAKIEDNGRTGELEISCRIEIAGDELHVTLSGPPQVPSYVNSYWANSLSSVYYGILIYAGVPRPYNEGIYRPIEVDLGPPGTLTNASHPAPCSASTTTIGDNVTDAVATAMSKAVPERANAGWCHCGGTNQIGTDPRTNDFYTFNMIIGTSGGAGASWGLDGWHCLNARNVAGACLTGDVELLETDYPVHIHRYELRTDSAGAGRWRGGLGSVFEEEPVGHGGHLVLWGEGYKHPAVGLLGAYSKLLDRKVTKKYLVEDGESRELPWHELIPIAAGQRYIASPGGGGGIGDPFEREVEAVLLDVRNEFVSVEAAREEYGVVVDPQTLELDVDATERLRARKREER